MKKEYPYIHALRLLATLAVVMLHTASGIYGYKEIYAEDANFNEHIFAIYKHLMTWAVPAFVMISGALLLPADKKTGYNVLFKKYIKRILLALLLFGLPMALSESFLSYKDESFSFILANGTGNWLHGHSWAHMWYLYMIIGLYLITPIIKPFINNATNRELEIALFVLFTLSSVMPTLENSGAIFEGYMLISTPYIFIYMLGYYLHDRAKNIKVLNSKILWSVLFAVSTLVMIFHIVTDKPLNGYGDPWCILMAASIFVLLRLLNINRNFAGKMAPLCFGVYIIHPLFINLSYKILDITPLNSLGNTHCSIAVPVFCAVFTVLSFIAAYLLRKIPFITKNIL